MKRPSTRMLLILAAIPAAFLGGWLLRPQPPTRQDTAATVAAPTGTMYTCSMHPQVRLADPDAPCPICGMDLIPVETGGAEADAGEAVLTLSPRARRLAEVETAPVERRYVESGVRLLGKVAADETRVRRISAWVGGRLDRLFVDFTGIRVSKGDHLAELYSPELIAAQEELLQLKSGAAGRAGSGLLDAARDKLRLLGLTERQVAELEERGRPLDRVTIVAPSGGIVLERQAVEGAYVSVGSPIVTIADLDQVWVQLDAFESDLPWLRYGQTVTFESVAHPGEPFTGQVAFVDPILDERSRTVKVRVNVPNPDGRLKPGMFVRATLRARLTADGRVADADLAGKWISPMHPEIVKDGPGSCDVCGMPLVPTESLGYVDAEGSGTGAPLVIPATAPLITGRRAVVYLADPEAEGRYAGREVVLGPRAGDYYLVREGLAEGERVVTRGAFRIDSALQIQARPSMMSPTGGTAVPGHNHGGMAMPPPGAAAAADAPGDGPRLAVGADFLAALEPVYGAYFALQRALSHDEPAAARDAAAALAAALGAVDAGTLDDEPRGAWAELAGAIAADAGEVAGATGIEDARTAFGRLSAAMIATGRRFGRADDGPLLVYHCPMAFDFAGADWLQPGEGTENPYFGASMFKCGTLQRDLGAAGGDVRDER